jgi:hypothetical protein
MSSPWAALSFATCFTAVLGSAAMLVGDEIAPLPLYALIMVGIELDNLIASYFRSINFSLPFQFVIAFVERRQHTPCYRSHGRSP